MPRYFQSLGAGRPIALGGRSFIFEPVEPMGGSWAGVLAVDDESAANILAEAGLEITAARYDELKKKVRGSTVPDFVPSRTPPQLPPQPIVVSAVRAEDRIGSASDAVPAMSPEQITASSSITLKTTSEQPPKEVLLEANPVKRRRSA